MVALFVLESVKGEWYSLVLDCLQKETSLPLSFRDREEPEREIVAGLIIRHRPHITELSKHHETKFGSFYYLN